MDKRFSHGKIVHRFASKLHGYYHPPFGYMKTLCLRGDIITPVLEQALEKAASICSSCKQTGRVTNSRKIAFARIPGTFNKHVQLDFFKKEFYNIPILHMFDVYTGFSSAHPVPSRERTLSVRAQEVNWIKIHGSRSVVSTDAKFFNQKIFSALRYFDIEFHTKPASRCTSLVW